MHVANSIAVISRRILLVEDHADSRAAMTRLLRMSGHHVADAADGASALRLAAAETFELALIDITLPDMDGFELLGRLRRHGVRQAIAVTGHALERERAWCAGFRECVVKPVQIDGLLRVIGDVGSDS
jgi:CheY-like chemotaxis protein